MTQLIRLRPYQARLYGRILGYLNEGQRKVLLNSGTGTGKTTIGLAVLAKLKREVGKGRITGALVVVPQRQIGDGFNLTADIEVPGRGKRPTVLSHDGVCRVVNGRQTAAISRHLRAKEPQDDFAIVSSHAALAMFKDRGLPRDLTGKLLVIDEAHHASTKKETNAISAVVAEWARRGGMVLAFSATPTRHDGAPVHDDTWAVLHRTVATHAADRDENGQPYVPQQHKIEWVTVAGYKAKSLKQIMGDEAAESDGSAERQIVKDWIDRGRPKAGFVVPGKGSRVATDRLKKHFAKAGARVLDAVGTDAETKRRVREVLASEKAVTRFEDSTVDVVIACRRLDEGTDWKLCSHIFVMGLPSSIPRAIQQWGRTMRRKDIEGHTHPDEATIVFMVPAFTADVNATMDESQRKHHHEFSTIMACYLHCHETANAYTAAGIVREASGKRRQGDPDERMERLADAIEMSEEQRARAAADLLALGAKAGKRTPKPLFDAIVEKSDTWDEQRVFSAMSLWFERFINHRSLDEKTRWELVAKVESAARAIRKSKSPAKMKSAIRTGMREAFEVAVEPLSHLTARDLDQEVMRTVSRWTGQTEQDVGERLRESMRESRTSESCEAEVLAFVKENGRSPAKRDMNRQAQWIRYNLGFNWSDWLVSIGVTPTINTGRTQESCEAEVRKYVENRGRVPKRRDLESLAMWVRCNLSLSWGSWLKTLGLRPTADFNRTRASCKTETLEFFKKYGRVPRRSDMPSTAHWIRVNLDEGWPNWLLSLGLEASRNHSRSRSSCESETRRFSIDNGSVPSQRDLPATSQWVRRCLSLKWSEWLRECGLDEPPASGAVPRRATREPMAARARRAKARKE